MKMLKDKKNRKLRIISFVILFLAAIVFLAPYFWMLSNSFKSTKEIDHNDDADGGNDDPELFAYIKTGMV